MLPSTARHCARRWMTAFPKRHACRFLNATVIEVNS
jgi:hypothetical protein